MERIFNRFFWGSYNEQARIHWSSWEECCYQVDEGGLGATSLQDISNCAAIKLWWIVRENKSNYGANILEIQEINNISIDKNALDSTVWKPTFNFSDI